MLEFKEIVQTHETMDFGKKYLFIPFPDSEQLIVLLSAHKQKGNYFLLKTFIESQKTNLLFITDPNDTWYLDNDGGATYVKILDKIFAKFNKKNIYVFGSSMAGYGALHFSIIKDVNCLVCNPQVDLNLSKEFGWHELNKHMNKVLVNGKAVNITHLLDNTIYTACLCIIHGHNPIDVANVELLLGSATPIRKLLVYTMDVDDHSMPFGRDVEKIYQVLELMRQFNDFNVSYEEPSQELRIRKNNRRKSTAQGYHVPHRFLAKRNQEQKAIHRSTRWTLRNQLQKPGIIFFSDVGYYISEEKLSGVFCTFDGTQFKLVEPFPSKHIILLNNFQERKLSTPLVDNEMIGPSLWCRVPNNVLLSIDGEGYYDAIYTHTKNCYLNWKLSFLLKSGFKPGQFISCLIDVEFTHGTVILSLGAYGEDGYYQSNKTLESSGKHCIVFQAISCIEHKDALFCRLYFYPDSLSKRVKINSLSLVKGYLPHLLFWNHPS